MEARLTEMGDTIKKLMVKVEGLRQENVALWKANEELAGGTKPSHNEHFESRCTPEIAMAEEERRMMYLELGELGDKYAEMAKWMATSSSIDQLLTSMDLLYRAEAMAVPLPSKFKVP